MTVLTDAVGRALALGDQLLDERGKIWQVEETLASFSSQRLAAVRELRLVRGRPRLGEPTYVRLDHVFRTEPFFWDLAVVERQRAWQRLYNAELSPRRRAEVARRRAETRRRREERGH